MDEHETMTKTSLFEQIKNETCHITNPMSIQRKTYDVLIVLETMGVVTITKQQLEWKRLPIELEETRKVLLHQKKKLEERVKQKQKELQRLLVEIVCLKNVRLQNEQREPLDSPQLPIPSTFISVPTHTSLDLHISDDKKNMTCTLEGPSSIHTRVDVLSDLGLAHLEAYDLPRLLPSPLVPFYPRHLILGQTP
jgi:hypothetical protein